MANINWLLDTVGYLAYIFVLLLGLLFFAGIISISKRIPAKHPLNRQAGKGLIIGIGFIIISNIATSSHGWINGWIIALIDVICLILMFFGVRIFLAAMKEIHKVD